MTRALEIGQSRGIFQTDAEPVPTPCEDTSTKNSEEAGNLVRYDDRRSAAVANEAVSDSFLLSHPVLAIALGVLLGLVLFSVLMALVNAILGVAVYEWLV